MGARAASMKVCEFGQSIDWGASFACALAAALTSKQNRWKAQAAHRGAQASRGSPRQVAPLKRPEDLIRSLEF